MLAGQVDGPPGIASLCLAFCLLAVCGGCASVPGFGELQESRAILPTPAPGVVADGRAQYREIFCTLARRDGVSSEQRGEDCGRLLWQLPDESRDVPAGTLPAVDDQLQFFMVGGAFSDCFGPSSIAYRRDIERLAGEGYRVATLPISGRSGAGHNAQMIADGLASAPPGPVVLIGYSKGTVDILRFLADYPEPARRVVAVISVAGPILGSEVAERGDWAYNTFLSGAFPGRCDPGDGGVVDSLLPAVRRDWLAQNPLPGDVRFYTLLAFATREHIARALMPTWRILAKFDLRNDGQLTLEDGTLPGSTLLGYANSDHWGLAIDIEDELSYWAARPDDRPFPRGPLFEAALRYVSGDLRRSGMQAGDEGMVP